MWGEPAPHAMPVNCQGYHGGENQAIGYFAFASPLNTWSGTRDFWTNTTGTIWFAPSNADGWTVFEAVNVIGPPDPRPPGAHPLK